MSVETMGDDEYGELHWRIIELMLAGRDEDSPWGYATPRYLAGEIDESRQLISNRLRDLQMGDVVEKVTRGFYRIVPEEIPEKSEDE